MRINASRETTLEARPTSLQPLRKFATRIGAQMGLNSRQINHLKLCIDEAGSNIIKHAYSEMNVKKKIFQVRMLNAPKYIETSMIDWGKDFSINVEALTSPDLDKYVAIKKKGGLGLFMIKKFMDEVEHKREGNKNILIMRQYVERPESAKVIFKRNLTWKQISLKLKFSFISAVSISVILLSIFLLAINNQKSSLKKQYFSNAEKNIKKLAANALPYMLENNDLKMTMLVKELKLKDQSIEYAGLIGSDDYIIAHTDVQNIYKKYQEPEVTDQKAVGDISGVELGRLKKDKKDLLYLSTSIKHKDLTIGKAFIVLSEKSLYKEINAFQSKLKLSLFTAFLWMLGVIGTYLLSSSFIQPLRELADEIKRISKEGATGRLYFKGKGEFAEVAQAFNKMMGELKQAEVELTDTTRLKKEMQLAKSIQNTLLPKNIPELEGYDIGAKYEAAMEVGGDYYDFFDVDKDSIGIAVGDVSGKGIAGALIMTMTRTALRLEARGSKIASEVLANLNTTLDGEFKKGMYITMFYVVLDSKKRVINYSSAGHNPMILYRGDTGQLYNFNPKGFAVGLDLGTPLTFRKAIKNESIKLKKGDLLFIYTDGITEAMNSKREEYGELRLLEAIKKYHHLPAQEVSDKVLDDIQDFTAGFPQSDDITYVVVKEKANVSELEYNKRTKLFELIEKENLSVKDACKKTGLTTGQYYRLKKIKDKLGMEALIEDVDESKRDIDRLDIEGSAKVLHLVADHPEYSIDKMQEALDSEEYGNYKGDTKMILRELKRLNLTTIDKRQRFAKREKMQAERGKKSVFLRSGTSKGVFIEKKQEGELFTADQSETGQETKIVPDAIIQKTKAEEMIDKMKKEYEDGPTAASLFDKHKKEVTSKQDSPSDSPSEKKSKADELIEKMTKAYKDEKKALGIPDKKKEPVMTEKVPVSSFTVEDKQNSPSDSPSEKKSKADELIEKMTKAYKDEKKTLGISDKKQEPVVPEKIPAKQEKKSKADELIEKMTKAYKDEKKTLGIPDPSEKKEPEMPEKGPDPLVKTKKEKKKPDIQQKTPEDAPKKERKSVVDQLLSGMIGDNNELIEVEGTSIQKTGPEPEEAMKEKTGKVAKKRTGGWIARMIKKDKDEDTADDIFDQKEEPAEKEEKSEKKKEVKNDQINDADEMMFSMLRESDDT